MNLDDWNIITEAISREQVMFPDDIEEKDRYYIGIEIQDEGKVGIIYHDRSLVVEDVIHELLHLVYPEKIEDEINEQTEEVLNEMGINGTDNYSSDSRIIDSFKMYIKSSTKEGESISL